MTRIASNSARNTSEAARKNGAPGRCTAEPGVIARENTCVNSAGPNIPVIPMMLALAPWRDFPGRSLPRETTEDDSRLVRRAYARNDMWSQN